MIRLLEFIVATIVVALIFVIIGVFLPSSRQVTHSTETNRPARTVIDTLAGFGRFPEWSPMRRNDPDARFEVSGPELGVGARLRHVSEHENVGTGTWELVELTEGNRGGRLVFELDNERHGRNKRMIFDVERRGRITTVTQTYSVDYGWSLPGRFAGLYVERNVGDGMARGLNSFAALMAQIPNIDYTGLRVERVEIPAQNVLYIPTESERTLQMVETAQVNQLRWIRQVMQKNNLEAAGPWRMITTNWGSEVYEFDIAVPVCRTGECPEPVVDPMAELDGADGENVGTVLDVPVDQEVPLRPGAEAMAEAEPFDPESIELEGEVRLGRSYEGRALKTVHNGHPAQLPVVREQLRAWAATRGEVVTGRAFEEYLQDIDDADPADSQYNVYWPVR